MTDLLDAMSSREVCRQTGATHRQLDYWVRTSVLAPSGYHGRSSGEPHRWLPSDLPRVRVVAALMAWNQQDWRTSPTSRARRVAMELGDVRCDEGFLVVSVAGDFSWTSDPSDLPLLCREHGPSSCVIDLEAIGHLAGEP